MERVISLVAFTAIYANLAVVEFGLIQEVRAEGPGPVARSNAPREPDSVENTPTTVY